MNTTTSAVAQAWPQDIVWQPMSSAPATEIGVLIDIWCAEDECRRTDCFIESGRWCYETFEAGAYRVVPVKRPAVWFRVPGAPAAEGL